MSTTRAKIELLVRSEAGDDFRVTKVESSLAYRQARPQRIAESQYEVAALRSNVRRTTTYVVKNRQTEKYIELTEAEKFLWDQMNGRTSVEELGVAYVLKFGAFDFAASRSNTITPSPANSSGRVARLVSSASFNRLSAIS